MGKNMGKKGLFWAVSVIILIVCAIGMIGIGTIIGQYNENLCDLSYFHEDERSIEFHPICYSIEREISEFYSDLGRTPDYVDAYCEGGKYVIDESGGTLCEYSGVARFNGTRIPINSSSKGIPSTGIYFYSISPHPITIRRWIEKKEMDDWRDSR